MESLKEKAYNFIRNKIVTCEFMPGDVIDEKKLMEETDCGRTPIREALAVLAGNGLVKVLPRRAIFVSNLTIKDIHDIYELKMGVEPLIIRTRGDALPQDRLHAYRKLFSNEEMDYYKYSVVDDEFHAMITDSSDNRYFKQIMDVVSDQSQRIRILTNVKPERLKESEEEHLVIIDALLEKNWDRAANAMEKHYQKAIDSIMRVGFMCE